MANPNTAIGIGIMREIPGLGMRSFEPDQTSPVQYKSYYGGNGGLDFMAIGIDGMLTKYDVGVDLPFDVDGTSYSADAVGLLQLYANQGWIYPTT